MEEEFELELGEDYTASEVFPQIIEFKPISEAILKLIANQEFTIKQGKYLENNKN